MEQHELDRRTIAAIFAALMIAMFVGSLDQTIVATALPTIVGELEAVDQMLWVTTAYFLTSTIAMPAYGKLGDMFGRKHLFLAALLFFIAGSLYCAMTGNMLGLIIGRAIQGLGGGGLMILSQAIIADIFPPKKRSKYMGVMGASFGVSMALGPLLGGLFTEYVSWRWCFWINIPLGIFALIVVAVALPHRVRTKPSLRVVDLPGMATLTGACACLVLAISLGGTMIAFDSIGFLALVAGAIVFAVLFVVAETRAKEPIIPLGIFKNRNFVICTLAGLVVMIAMSGVISYLPTYLQIVQGLEATPAGYMIIPLMLAMMATSTVAGFVASKAKSVKWMPLLSCAVTAAALALLATITVDTSLLQLALMLALLGFGIGIGQQILVLIVQNEFPVSMVGTATAANNFFREIGGTIGGSAVGAIFTSNLIAQLSANLGSVEASINANGLTPQLVRSMGEPLRSAVEVSYNDALAPVFGLLAPIVLIAFVLLLFLKNKPLSDTNEMHEYPLLQSEPTL